MVLASTSWSPSSWDELQSSQCSVRPQVWLPATLATWWSREHSTCWGRGAPMLGYKYVKDFEVYRDFTVWQKNAKILGYIHSSLNNTQCSFKLPLWAHTEPRRGLLFSPVSSYHHCVSVNWTTEPRKWARNGGLARVLSGSNPLSAVSRAVCNLPCPVWQPKTDGF